MLDVGAHVHQERTLPRERGTYTAANIHVRIDLAHRQTAANGRGKRALGGKAAQIPDL